jgi:hypothetical protein
LTDNELVLSESDIWDMISFTRSLYTGAYGGVFTPDLISSKLKDITLNPLAATQSTLEKALQDPKNSEFELMEFSEDFEIQSQPYKRLLGYLGNMLSWDLTYSCKNAKFEDYKKPAYEKDLDIVMDFLDKLDYRKEFTTAVKEMLRNETFFCCPRLEGNAFVLQELPASPTYTKITGRWDYGLLFSFNMYWFAQSGVDIEMYPGFFKKKYSERQ